MINNWPRLMCKVREVEKSKFEAICTDVLSVHVKIDS